MLNRLFPLCKFINLIASFAVIFLFVYVVASVVLTLKDPRVGNTALALDVFLSASKVLVVCAAALLLISTVYARLRAVDTNQRDDLIWAWIFAVPWLLVMLIRWFGR